MGCFLYHRYEIVFRPMNYGGHPLEELLNNRIGGALGEYVALRSPGNGHVTRILGHWSGPEKSRWNPGYTEVRACVPEDKTPDEILHEMDEQLQPLGWAIFDWRAGK